MFFVEYMISIVVLPVGVNLGHFAIRKKLTQGGPQYLETNVFWTPRVYSFEVIVRGSKFQLQLLGLDLLVALHGIGGLLYISLAKDDSFRKESPEMFYLMATYMWVASVGSLWKIARYLYLFKILFSRMTRRHCPSLASCDLPVLVLETDSHLAPCLMCNKDMTGDRVVTLPCRCKRSTVHEHCCDRWFNVEGHINCPACLHTPLHSRFRV